MILVGRELEIFHLTGWSRDGTEQVVIGRAAEGAGNQSDNAKSLAHASVSASRCSS
jgi:hypothetical protein